MCTSANNFKVMVVGRSMHHVFHINDVNSVNQNVEEKKIIENEKKKWKKKKFLFTLLFFMWCKKKKNTLKFYDYFLIISLYIFKRTKEILKNFITVLPIKSTKKRHLTTCIIRSVDFMQNSYRIFTLYLKTENFL